MAQTGHSRLLLMLQLCAPGCLTSVSDQGNFVSTSFAWSRLVLGSTCNSQQPTELREDQVLKPAMSRAASALAALVAHLQALFEPAQLLLLGAIARSYCPSGSLIL